MLKECEEATILRVKYPSLECKLEQLNLYYLSFRTGYPRHELLTADLVVYFSLLTEDDIYILKKILVDSATNSLRNFIDLHLRHRIKNARHA